MRRRTACSVLLVASATPLLNAQSTDGPLRKSARDSLRRAASFYHSEIARHGGYVYYTSADLKDRWGEGKAGKEVIVVQPPGTPTVGLAYLQAYHATGDEFYLKAAAVAAEALVYGQLSSGGWTQTIDFDPATKAGKYRNGKGRNTSSLDDGQTQSALLLLMEADKALGFKHKSIHEAALFGLDSLLKAQFANGAFPQAWTGAVSTQPIMPAKYPEYDWKTEGRLKNYWDYYTLNDGLAGTVAETLMAAHRIYAEDKYKAALARLGDFLILAQMPSPQPAWCQQYNYEMVPIWARKFEPPAVSGWESQDVMETLITISRHTGDKKYFRPIPAALEYLQACVLPEGKIARFYELKTNKPLYMDADYQLTYDDSAAPAHYGWKQSQRLKAIQQELESAEREEPIAEHRSSPKEKDVRRIVAELDSRGAWVSTYAGESLVGHPKFPSGFQYISSSVFHQNVQILSDYLQHVR